MVRKKTTEQFIEEAEDKYDYSDESSKFLSLFER